MVGSLDYLGINLSFLSFLSWQTSSKLLTQLLSSELTVTKPLLFFSGNCSSFLCLSQGKFSTYEIFKKIKACQQFIWFNEKGHIEDRDKNFYRLQGSATQQGCQPGTVSPCKFPDFLIVVPATRFLYIAILHLVIHSQAIKGRRHNISLVQSSLLLETEVLLLLTGSSLAPPYTAIIL